MNRGSFLGALPWVTLLWFTSTFWQMGDVAKGMGGYYGYAYQRDPLTGALPPHYPFHMYMMQDGGTPHRCLGMMYVNLFHAGLLHHVRVAIFLEALLHGLVVWSLYRLLRLMQLSIPASVAASLLFLSAPVAYQAVAGHGFGFVMISTYLFFLLTAVYVGGTAVRPRLPVMAVLAATSLCFYEATAPLYPCLPLLYAAAHGAELSSLRRRPVLMPVAGIVAVFLLYAALIVATRTPIKRGGVDSFVAPDQLAAQTAAVARRAVGFLDMNGLLGDAMREGWRCISGSHWMAWCMVCAGAACLWLWWWNHACEQVPVPMAGQRKGLFSVLAFGILAVVLPWSLAVPIRVPSCVVRFCYFPVAGAAMAAAAGLDLLHGWRSRGYRMAIGILVLTFTTCGAMALVGVQSWFEQEARRDWDFAAGMRELIPTPPPAAFFVPISLCPQAPDEATRTKLSYQAAICPPAWADSVGGSTILNWNYHRHDISYYKIPGENLMELERWPERLWNRGEVFEEADARSFRIQVPHTNGQEHEVRSWRNVIAFTVDCNLHMRLIGKILLEHPDNSDEEVNLPWVAAAASHPDQIGEIALDAPRPGQAPFSSMLWAWNRSGQPVSWQHTPLSALRRKVSWLQAKTPASAIRALLAPSVRPLHIYFRALSTAERASLAVLLSSNEHPSERTLLARIPMKGMDHGRWKRITIEVKPHSTPQCLTIKLLKQGACALSEPVAD